MSDHDDDSGAERARSSETPPIFKPPPPPIPPSGPPPTLTHPVARPYRAGRRWGSSSAQRALIISGAVVLALSLVLLAVGAVVSTASWASTAGVVGLVLCALIGVSFAFTGRRR